MLRRIRFWDAISKVAAGLCLASVLLPFILGAYSASETETPWWGWLLTPLALAFLFPFLAAPQLSMLFLIRKSRSEMMRIIFLVASLAMLGAFGRFLMTADLISTSTASLAVIFYPLYLGIGSLAVGGLIFWLHRWLTRVID